MDVYLDEQPLTVSEMPSTLGELISRARETAAKGGRVIVSVFCDGRDISNNDLEARRAEPADSLSRVEFTSGHPAQIVQDALAQALTILDGTEPECARVVEWLTQGQTQQAATALGQCFRAWAQVHTAIIQSVALLGLDLETMVVNGQRLEAALLAIADQLKQVKEVLEAGDYVLLADLLQYEFGQSTGRWRGTIEAIQARLEPAGSSQ